MFHSWVEGILQDLHESFELFHYAQHPEAVQVVDSSRGHLLVLAGQHAVRQERGDTVETRRALFTSHAGLKSYSGYWNMDSAVH